MVRMFIILLLGVFTAYSQEVERDLDTYLKNKFIELDCTWNEKGYWGNAFNNIDNRYNEAILFYAFYEDNYGRSLKDKINKAVNFSFTNLQGSSGAMLQNGKDSHIRTSLFLYALVNVEINHQGFLRKEFVISGVNRAFKFLESPHIFSSNQNIAAMMTLYGLFKVTREQKYFDLYLVYRNWILSNFNKATKYSGYWPEAPVSWKNRLNTPYLFVQVFFLQEYLTLTNDPQLETHFNWLTNFLNERIDREKLTLDVTDSYGNFKAEGVREVEISSATLFFTKNLRSKYINQDLVVVLKKTSRRFDINCNNIDFLINTDLYFRFATVKRLLEKKRK